MLKWTELRGSFTIYRVSIRTSCTLNFISVGTSFHNRAEVKAFWLLDGEGGGEGPECGGQVK